jgi:hypothetical protein
VLLEVDTVRVEVPGPPPLIVTRAVLKEQPGAGEPPVIMLQERLTLPVYPFAGVTVMVEVESSPAVTDPGFKAVALSV